MTHIIPTRFEPVVYQLELLDTKREYDIWEDPIHGGIFGYFNGRLSRYFFLKGQGSQEERLKAIAELDRDDILRRSYGMGYGDYDEVTLEEIFVHGKHVSEITFKLEDYKDNQYVSKAYTCYVDGKNAGYYIEKDAVLGEWFAWPYSIDGDVEYVAGGDTLAECKESFTRFMSKSGEAPEPTFSEATEEKIHDLETEASELYHKLGGYDPLFNEYHDNLLYHKRGIAEAAGEIRFYVELLETPEKIVKQFPEKTEDDLKSWIIGELDTIEGALEYMRAVIALNERHKQLPTAIYG